MQDALVIQRPDARSDAQGGLLLLFHGVGSNAEGLRPLGDALARHRPGAAIVSVRSPQPSDFGTGWQWFSVNGVTEANRPARVADAMPAFLRTVAHWRRETSTGAAGTTLIGFSQGAIMALEATQHDPSLAGQVISIAGRFAQPPLRAPLATVHLLHGELDRVMPVSLAEDAARQLGALGARATLDRFPGLGHGIDSRVLAMVVRRLDPPTVEPS